MIFKALLGVTRGERGSKHSKNWSDVIYGWSLRSSWLWEPLKLAGFKVFMVFSHLKFSNFCPSPKGRTQLLHVISLQNTCNNRIQIVFIWAWMNNRGPQIVQILEKKVSNFLGFFLSYFSKKWYWSTKVWAIKNGTLVKNPYFLSYPHETWWK